jgi:glycine dehydrogenase subunit 2
MHEFVLSAAVHGPGAAHDIAKRILDFGMHAPTVYFPLIVQEALMIEPTETEHLAMLDDFAEVMGQIHGELTDDPEAVATAPHSTPVRRPDEARAARDPIFRWSP